MSYSPEPWSVDEKGGRVLDAKGAFLVFDAPTTIEDWKNMRRIVACVNFFQDFPQDDLTLLASVPLSLSEARCRVADIIEIIRVNQGIPIDHERKIRSPEHLFL